ncbi:MAG: hydrogenase maturation nickel metallochaperone HypA [Candidatus Omnitrophota bacterium]|nr:hydrogenase maturation nickel metallochaperone HypA [Candidatus Omnitrophota bacterium]
MHEYHLVQSVLKTILAKTSGMPDIKKITAIKLKLGNLKMVSKETFGETFKEISKDTICEGAGLDIEEVMGDVMVVENIEGEYKK